MRFQALLFTSLVALTTAASGCIHEPAVYDVGDEVGDLGPTAAPPQSPPVSTYPMPANDPKGTVYVMSLGPERLATGNNAQSLFLHTRVAAENKSDDLTWKVDPNDEVAGFGNGAPVAPAFAEVSTGGPIPVLTLTKGQRGHLDLYYPLPPTGEPPRVALNWRLHRGDEVLAQTTSFERTQPPGNTGYAYYRPYGPDVHLAIGYDWWWWPWGAWGWGWGAPWYRPYWAWGGGWGWDYPYYPRYGGYY